MVEIMAVGKELGRRETVNKGKNLVGIVNVSKRGFALRSPISPSSKLEDQLYNAASHRQLYQLILDSQLTSR